MSLRDDYETDTDDEVNGRWFRFKSGARMKLAAADAGANPAYGLAHERVYAPHRLRQQTGAISETEHRELLIRVFAEAVVKGWEGVTVGDFDPKAPNSATEVPFSAKACVELFTSLPHLFFNQKSPRLGVYQLATDMENFQKAQREADAKNS